MEKSKNIPTLRFPEFDGEWTKKTLEEVSLITMGQSPDSKSYNNLGIGLPLIQGNADIIDRKTNPRNWTSQPTKKCNTGDLILTVRAPVGMIAKSIHNACIGRGVCAIKNKNLNNLEFIYQFLLDYESKWGKIEQGSTFTAVSGTDIKLVTLFIPSILEQNKIASFLTVVDDKLQALKQKKTLLEQHKKGLMQKIFSQELRFKDDNGNGYPDWEEKKLGDIGYTYNGLTGKTKEHFGNGKPYIQYKQIFDDSKIDISRFELVKISPSENQNKVVFGDVFFTVSSETPNEIGTASVLLNDIDELYLNSFCFGYRASKLTLSPYFSRYLFRNELFRNQIIKLAQGSTRFNMSKLQLIKLIVKLPCLEEQTKIANFLYAIDDKINHCQSQIEKTEVWKKGLLQQMFC